MMLVILLLGSPSIHFLFFYRHLPATVEPRQCELHPNGVAAGDDAVTPTLALVAWPPAVRANLEFLQAAGVSMQSTTTAPRQTACTQHGPAWRPVIAKADRAPWLVSQPLVHLTLPLETTVNHFAWTTLPVGAAGTDPIWRGKLSEPGGVVAGTFAVEEMAANPAAKRGCAYGKYHVACATAAVDLTSSSSSVSVFHSCRRSIST